MMNPQMPMGGPPMGGGPNPQSQEFLMRLLQALFGGQLGQGMPGAPGGMPPTSMGGGFGPEPRMTLPPTMKIPGAGTPEPPTVGQGPFADFDRGLPKTRY